MYSHKALESCFETSNCLREKRGEIRQHEDYSFTMEDHM